MPVFALAPAAATAFWGATAAGATAAAGVYGAHKQASSAEKAATIQSAALNKQAEIEAQSAKEALDFTKEQDAANRASADKAQHLAYDQYADKERRIGNLGTLLGLPGRNPAPYESVVYPNGAPGSTSSSSSAASTMPTTGEVDWSAPTPVLTKQLTDFFTKRGVSADEVPYWSNPQKVQELITRGQQLNDPLYASKRLAAAEVFGGGGMASPAAAAPAAAPTGLAAYALPQSNYVKTPALYA